MSDPAQGRTDLPCAEMDPEAVPGTVAELVAAAGVGPSSAW
jgi:hypothetical protein